MEESTGFGDLLAVIFFPNVLKVWVWCVLHHAYAGTSLDQPSTETRVGETLPEVNILRKERHFQGMLKYRKEDETKLFRTLITGDKYFSEITKHSVLFNNLNWRLYLWLRSKAQRGCSKHASRHPSLYSLHVPPPRWLHKQWPESPHTAHQLNQQHQECAEGESSAVQTGTDKRRQTGGAVYKSVIRQCGYWCNEDINHIWIYTWYFCAEKKLWFWDGVILDGEHLPLRALPKTV